MTVDGQYVPVGFRDIALAEDFELPEFLPQYDIHRLCHPFSMSHTLDQQNEDTEKADELRANLKNLTAIQESFVKYLKDHSPPSSNLQVLVQSFNTARCTSLCPTDRVLVHPTHSPDTARPPPAHGSSRARVLDRPWAAPVRLMCRPLDVFWDSL